MKIDVTGIGFDNVTMAEALDKAKALLQEDRTVYCVTPNAEIAYEAMHGEELRSILNGADLVLPDGAGVVLASKILGTPLKEKVAGVDFADRLMDVMVQEGYRLYLLGSKPGIAELAAEKMLQKHPGLIICGTADGYFKDEDAVVAKVNEAQADILFVCLGAPKQEQFMARHKDALNVRMMLGLGGTLDSFAGTVKRAPKWMIAMNLEWFYRLLKEPKRLGRMMRLPKFILAVIGRKCKR
jgi:N-acetylglucosaminyldiphosphoundecaprenol N-acetyl-beta-D-mannosaminyltransferase